MLDRIMDEASDAVYVCDKDTYLLLYMNQKARELSDRNEEDYRGKKCYEYFLNYDRPCSFCRVNSLSEDYYTKRQHSTKNGNKYYVIKGKIIDWYGTKAHVEFIIDETEKLTALKRMQKIIDNVPSGICMYRIKNTFDLITIAVNKNYEKITGYPVDEIMNKYAEDPMFCIYEADKAEFIRKYKKAISSKEQLEHTYRIVTKNGELRWVMIRAVGQRIDSHNIDVYAVFNDVTDEMKRNIKIEERFREVEEYDSLVAYNTITSYRVNLTKDIIEICKSNNIYTKKHEHFISTKELVDEVLYTVENHENKDRIIKIFDKRYLICEYEKGRTELEIKYRRNIGDNAYRWIKTCIKMVSEPSTGDIIAFIYAYDIDEEIIIKSIMEKIITKENDCIMYINGKRNCAKMFMMEGKGFDTKIYEIENADIKIENYFRQKCADENVDDIVQKIKIEHVCEKLKEKEYYIVYYTMRSDDDKVMYKKGTFSYIDEKNRDIFFVSTNITQIVMKEREQRQVLLQTLELAEQGHVAKSNFLSNMSHDIRTPLNAILGMTELARLDINDSQKVSNSLSIIEASSKNLINIINDVLDMSKIESGSNDICDKKFAISSVIDEIKKIFAQVFESRKQKFIVITNIVHNNVYGDYVKMNRVISNRCF